MPTAKPRQIIADVNMWGSTVLSRVGWVIIGGPGSVKMVGRTCGKESGRVLEFTPRYAARREAIGRGGGGR